MNLNLSVGSVGRSVGRPRVTAGGSLLALAPPLSTLLRLQRGRTRLCRSRQARTTIGLFGPEARLLGLTLETHTRQARGNLFISLGTFTGIRRSSQEVLVIIFVIILIGIRLFDQQR